MKKVQNLILSIGSTLLLSAGWFGFHVGWLSLIAFVPLLFVIQSLLCPDVRRGKAKIFGYSYLTFVLWNVITTWWVYYASPAGAVAAILVSSLFMSGSIWVTSILWQNGGRKIGLMALVCNWVTFEYLFMNSEIAWPWLILGNSFANNISLVQWYEFTGHLGGSVWILIVNVLVFLLVDYFRKEHKLSIKYLASASALVFVPMIASVIRYATYKEVENPQNVVIIQPNIDPYHEKFDENTFANQIENILDIASTNAKTDIDYFIAPETALNGIVQEDCLWANTALGRVQKFMHQYPDAKFVIGATSIKVYYDGVGKTITAREIGANDYYDIYNVSMQVDSCQPVQIYRKSKLVPGAEILPYIRVFGFMSDLMTDLGGISGSHGTQPYPTTFDNDVTGMKVGCPVCYESAFGEHVADFTIAGAEMIFVITNDGWWYDTPGYRQHCSFSRLRAVETRRCIARSANTGISCVINQRGDVVQSLGWWKRGGISATINANNKITFYAKYGDFLARMCGVISAFLIILQMVTVAKKKVAKKEE